MEPREARSKAQAESPSPTSRRTLLLVGANHRTCGLDERETLLRRATYPRLRKAGGAVPPWEDLVLLTTCNRIEAYAITASPQECLGRISAALEVTQDSASLYVLQGPEAAAHLLRVASGLDSLAQGEGQVTDQVRRAPEQRPSFWRKSDLLASLFGRAAHAAPRIRTLAGLDEGAVSASHVAVRFMTQVVPVPHPTVLLLGTGKMARIGAEALRRRAEILVLNRDPKRAREVAKGLGGRGAGLDALERFLARADVVLAATATKNPIITPRHLRAVQERRKGRLLWMIDLGFPRNIDPRCRGIRGVTLTDIDGLAPWGAQLPPPGRLAHAENRIREEASRLLEPLRPSAAFDVAEFRRAVEALRREEVEETLARLPRLAPEDRAVIDKLAARLVNRFLHGPTEQLRVLPEETRNQIVQQLVHGLQARGGGPR